MCAKSSSKGPSRAAARRQVAGALAAAGRIIVTTHLRPDGDAVGSAAAVRRAARAAGKECRIVLLDSLPRRYAFLLGDDPPAGADQFAELAGWADCVLIVDTCAFRQLEPIADDLKAVREKVAVIDHHATADDVGAVAWRDTSASSAGVMVAELLAELDWPVDPHIAEALAAALLTDTGWLRYSNTDGRTLKTLARLLSAGVETDVLYRKIYQSDRPERLALLAAALVSLELHAGGRLAVMSLRAEDLAATGATHAETENFVSEPMRLADVEVSVILIAMPGGQTRVSLRSRGAVDVAALAQRFGGGGHVAAAGFTDEDALPAAKARLIAACEQALAGGA